MCQNLCQTLSQDYKDNLYPEEMRKKEISSTKKMLLLAMSVSFLSLRSQYCPKIPPSRFWDPHMLKIRFDQLAFSSHNKGKIYKFFCLNLKKITSFFVAVVLRILILSISLYSICLFFDPILS